MIFIGFVLSLYIAYAAFQRRSLTAGGAVWAVVVGTTLFGLGPEKGLKFIESWTNASALFVVRESEGLYRQLPSSRFPLKPASD